MSTEKPKTIRIKARDVEPYRYGLWCSIEDGPPFVNDIVHAQENGDGTIWFILDTHNFKRVHRDEELELVPLDDGPVRKSWRDVEDDVDPAVRAS